MAFVGTKPGQLGSTLRTGNFVIVPATSGGIALTSGVGICRNGIRIKFLAGGTGTINIGSSDNPPYVSGGFVLDGADFITLGVSNPNNVRVFASTSGNVISWMGFDL